MQSVQTLQPVVEIGRPRVAESAGAMPPHSQAELDAALEALQANKERWVELEIAERIAILDEIQRDLWSVADRWIELSMAAKELPANSYGEGEEWFVLGVVFRTIRLLRQSLVDIQKHGLPQIPGSPTTRADGQVVVPVFPLDLFDKFGMPGTSGEIWMDPQSTDKDVALRRASFYTEKDRQGRVVLVLGAGNVAALVPADFLYKLFVEGQVVALKFNPVNAYLGPVIERGFQSLIKRGFLRILYGGAREGAYLCQHPAIDEIHLTGSDKTFDTIVFGSGAEGARRKAERQPVIHKRISAELGNVSPVIVVPGPWSEEDVRAQAGKLASGLVSNAGFNCLTPRVIIQSRYWEQRSALNRAIGDVLSQVDTRKAYYPGAQELHARYISAHPEAQRFGAAERGHLPWTFIQDLDPYNVDDVCFRCEPFCSLFAETALKADGIVEFIDRAVAFANENLWGTLVASIYVHPKSLRDPEIAQAVERAIADLRYGTVVVNHNGVMGYLLSSTSWGGYPGQDIYDVQSGIGVVNNTLMFDHPQKSVVRSPFRQSPDPFALTSKRLDEFARKWLRLQDAPSLRKLAGLIWTAMRS